MRTLIWLHRWLGITAGMFLLLIALSGFLLLWMNEYIDWRYPSLPDDGGSILPDAVVMDQLFATTRPGIASLGMPTETRPFYHAYLVDGTQRIFHPETGVALADWTWTDAIPVFLFEVHARLLAGETGHLLVGVVGIVCLIMIPSGALLWFRRRRQLKLRFFLPRGFSQAQLLRGHGAQGALLSIVLLVVGITGTAMVFSDPFRVGLYRVLGVNGPVLPEVRTIPAVAGSPNWAEVLAAAQREFPAARLRFITPPRSTDSPVSLRLKMPDELHPNGRSYLTLHPVTSEPLERIDATTRGLGPIVFDVFYPIHSGKTGWPGHRLVLALMAVSLMYLVSSGVVLYYRRSAR